MKAEQVTGPEAVHGEGACWVDDVLLYVDMLAGDVLRLDADGHVDRWHVDSVAALVRPRAGGGLVVAGERTIHLAPAYAAEPERSVVVLDDPDLRLNEGDVDPEGRLWCGTTSWSEAQGTGTLYRFDDDLAASPVITGISVSNGLAWTAGGDRAYYADSATGRIDVLEDGERRPFATVEGGVPDGLCVDADGGVWVAIWEGGAVQRYDADGTLCERVEVPARLVTSCTFGGPGLTDLFVTTSRLDEPTGPTGPGSVFRVPTTTAGVPVTPAAL